MEEKKIRIWEQLAYSVYKPGKYLEMLNITTGKSVRFIVVLMLLVTLMLEVIPISATIVGFGGWKKLFSSMPEISVQNGVLDVESTIDLNMGVMHFYVDNDALNTDYGDLQDDTYYVLIGSEDIRYVLVDGDTAHTLGTAKVSQMIPDGFSNQTLIDCIPLIYALLILGIIFCFIAYFAKYAVLALIYSIMAGAVNNQMEMGLSYGKLFMLCFYAQTLGIILVSINKAVGTIIPPFIMSAIGIFITMHFLARSMMGYGKGTHSNEDE